MHGQADELALEVVQRSVDRGARRELLPRQPVEDVVERERIVAERVRCASRYASADSADSS